jgi:hypothetical protein
MENKSIIDKISKKFEDEEWASGVINSAFVSKNDWLKVLVHIENKDLEIENLKMCLEKQGKSALMGMDAAKKSASIMLKNAEKLFIESSPELIESERAANEVLTNRVDTLETELNALKKEFGINN